MWAGQHHESAGIILSKSSDNIWEIEMGKRGVGRRRRRGRGGEGEEE